jgi:molybdopterin converting factor small subunit
MRIPVTFYSYFRDLTGCASVAEDMPPESTLSDLYARLISRFPKLAPMEKSTLIAVGVEYQTRDYVLKDSDEVALFPPVQGG